MKDDEPFARVKLVLHSGTTVYAASENALLSTGFSGLKPVKTSDEASIYTMYRAGVLVVMLTTHKFFDDAIIQPVSFQEWVESTK